MIPSNTLIAPRHAYEMERLEALDAYGMMGTPSESHLDDIVALIADTCGTSIGLLSLVGDDQVWFKSRYNFEQEWVPRDGSFCSHAILHDKIMVVENTLLDERFKHHPDVISSEFGVRFYAGVPLITDEGLPVGVLCAVDTRPNVMSELQIRTMQTLAKQVMVQMNLHKNILDSQRDLENLHNENRLAKTLNSNKDKFVALIAHDLKAAFHGLLGFSEVLDTEFDELTPESIRKIISYLNDTSQSTYKLLENLLEWAMVENGSMIYRAQKLDLKQIVDDITVALHLSAQQKQIDIFQNIQQNTLVYTDANMLKSLLRNILFNALKFSTNGGQIKIYDRLDHDRLHVFIEDQGVGMDQAQLDRLFNTNLTQTTKGTNGEMGTGLGLILCKQFAQKLGGRLNVQSTLGQGTIFSFSLALAKR